MKLSRVTMLGVLAPLAITGGVLVATAGGGTGDQQHVGHVEIYTTNLTVLDAAPLPIPLPLPLPSPLPTLIDPNGLPTCC